MSDSRIPAGVTTKADALVFAPPVNEPEAVLWTWPTGTVLPGGDRLARPHRLVSWGTGGCEVQARYGPARQYEWSPIGPADDTGIAEELAGELAHRLRVAGLVPEPPDDLEP